MTLSQVFNTQTKTITFAAGVLVFSSLVSGVLGFLRNGLLAWRFGAGETTDMYLAAFRIPDFLHGILILGGVSVVFLPLFSEYFERDQKEAWEFMANLLNILLVGLGILAAVVFFLIPFLIEFVIPGFSEGQQATTAKLAQFMLLSPILLGVSAVFSGVLQYFGKFLAYSLAPILYNVGIIVGIVFLAPFFGIWGLGIGVVGGALIHLAIQVPAALHSGFRWQPLLRVRDRSIPRALRFAFPRTIAAAGYHLNLIAMTAFASLISVGSITIFNYADFIQYFPVGLIGTSFAIAAFPALSRFFAEKNMQQFQEAFTATFRQIVFFVAPISILLFLLRAQIVRLVYGAGNLFTWDDTRLTAAALGIFAFGILFQALIPFLARAFFSVHDTKTPTMISIGSVSLNIALAFLLMDILASSNVLSGFLVVALKLQGISDIRILALPLALVLSGIFQAAFLALFLRKYVREILQKELYLSLAKTMLATLVSGATTYGILQIYGGVFPLTTYEEVLGQLVLASVGGIAAYLLAAFLIKSPEMLYFWNSLHSA